MITGYKQIVNKHTKQDFPQDPKEQLFLAIDAVFDSWNNQRAILYRRLNKIPDHFGTAVNIQSMVFGNMGNDSGTGVAFTRNPSTGENILYGEYLINAQGEDVVAGIRTPQAIHILKQDMPESISNLPQLVSTWKITIKICRILNLQLNEVSYIILQSRWKTDSSSSYSNCC